MTPQEFFTSTAVAYSLLMILIVLTALLFLHVPQQRGKTTR